MINPKNGRATDGAKPPRRGDRIATYITRGIICCVGLALLITFVGFQLWKNADFETCVAFCAITGLCLGYGLGEDIWGARLFGLFSHLNTQRLVRQDGKPQPHFTAKATFFVFAGVLVCLIVIFIWTLKYGHQPPGSYEKSGRPG
jgi:hypothetical protein